MPYLSIACVLAYVIGHALGPSMYLELILLPLPTPAASAIAAPGWSSLQGLWGPLFLLQWGVGRAYLQRKHAAPWDWGREPHRRSAP